MPAAKIAITVDVEMVKLMDRLVREGKYKSRSGVVQEALKEKLKGGKRKRLAEEASKLDPKEEKKLAEEFLLPVRGEGDEY
jgi:Arc/MetJ-type ribon-helix-helix transcriptional regulator